jgi:hypothetical protein
MRRIDLQDTTYLGTTSSALWRGPQGTLGSSSLTGRREKVWQATTAGIAHVTETFRCRCGAGRHVQREVPTT